VAATPPAPSEPRWALIAIALVVAISALELLAPPERVFLGLLVVPPLVAAAATRPRITGWIGVLALAAAFGLGVIDRIFLTQDHLIRLVTVLAAGTLAVLLAAARARSEQSLAATYRISQSVHSAPTLHEQLKAIHGIVGELMPARNFYIALYDAQREMISFPYFVDEEDEAPEPKRPGKGVTEYVLRTGRALLATPAVVQDLERRGEVELFGTPSVDWLGVPLIRDGATMGVLVVQSYTEGVRYTETDKRLLQFVSTQVAMAVGRKHADEALRHSEEGLRDFVDHAVFGISRSTADGRVSWANDALARMLGYGSAEEMNGLDVAKHFWRNPAAREGLVERVRATGRFSRVEVEAIKKDGTPLQVSLSGRRLTGADGSFQGMDVIVEDITELRALEDQLRQAQKMEAVGQLAGGVAHDFNNLLTTVLASNELLAASLPADAPQREDAEAVRAAAQRGADLTRKLLAFSRQQSLERRTIALGTLLADFTRLARRVLPEDVEIVLQAGAPGMAIRADPGAVEQILMNLVTNARDAMPPGGTLRLEAARSIISDEHCRAWGWGRPGEYVVLSVSDTGTGMDPETRRRIFEPFFTTKPVDQGTGLGMAMVYGLVKQHDGYVDVSSEPGQGTTVRVYFPVAAEVAAEPDAAAPPQIKGGSERILLVEDDVSVRRAATRVLERFGYTVVPAEDGVHALTIMDTLERAPDLIISDIVMPRASGSQLLHALHEAGLTPRILFTSGYTARDANDRAALDPALPFLPKPWTITDLLRKVREVLDEPVAAGLQESGPAAPKTESVR
jgi:PAS domain S-box-containing protein